MNVYNITPKIAVPGNNVMDIDGTVLPRLSKNAITVLEKRYLRRDQNGQVMETAAHFALRHRACSLRGMPVSYRRTPGTSTLWVNDGLGVPRV